MKAILILSLLFLMSCGKIDSLYNQLNGQIQKLNDLKGNISLDGLLGFDQLNLDFGQVMLGSNAVKNIHIDNQFVDNLTLNLDSIGIKAPVYIDSNSCINVKYQQSCDIVVRLDGSGSPIIINQVLKINGISLSIIGSIVANPGAPASNQPAVDPQPPTNIGAPILPRIPVMPKLPQVLLNPVDHDLQYGKLLTSYKYKAIVYVTNTTGADLDVTPSLDQDINGLYVTGCDLGLKSGETCAVTIWMEANFMDLGDYNVGLAIADQTKVIHFSVRNPRYHR